LGFCGARSRSQVWGKILWEIFVGIGSDTNYCVLAKNLERISEVIEEIEARDWKKR
jgi:hypothetical protein